ncbi:MAG: hypothetical protein ACOY71_08310 [Gemmatimonadota bacterium]
MANRLRERLIARSVSGRFGLFIGLGGALAVAGLGLFLMSLGDHADRAWQLFHVNWIVFTGLTAGSLAITAVHKIAKAKWSGVIIRFSQAAVAFIPVSLVGFLLIYTVGYEHVYGHMLEVLPTLFHGKQVWLSHGFMFTRLGLGLLLLFGLGFALIRADLVPDLHAARGAVTGSRRALFERWSAGFDGSPEAVAANDAKIYRLAPLFALAYAIVMTMIAFDAIMALQPHWFSNLFGGWFFMGSFLGAHTLQALLMLYGARHLGIADLVSPKQRHDHGKMVFGMSVFWTYLMWAQFLVIWYGNLPEETGFVFSRLWGPWMPVGRWVFLGMFIIPFIGLLGAAAKKNPVTLGLFTAVSLFTLWVERYLMVMPSVTHEPGPVFGLPELGPTLAFIGLFLLAYGLFARTFPMVSPRLAEITLTLERGHGHGHEFLHEEAIADYVPDVALERREKGR